MEDPVTEIPRIIHLLTQSTPSVQRRTIETYFTPSASLTHPFCRTGSFSGSRWLIIWVYRFYKIMSPRIDLNVKSVAFDADNLLLYVTLTQIFRIFIIPFYVAPVTLTTVLTLSTSHSYHDSQQSEGTSSFSITANGDGNGNGQDATNTGHSFPSGSDAVAPESSSRTLYYISAQNDLYQVSEFVKFVVPFGVGTTLVLLWHSFATFFSVMGAVILWPISFAEEIGVLPVSPETNMRDEKTYEERPTELTR